MTMTENQNSGPHEIDWHRAYRELEEQMARMLEDIADAMDRQHSAEGADGERAASVSEAELADQELKVAWLRGRLRQVEDKLEAKRLEVKELRSAIAVQSAQIGRAVGVGLERPR
ncbi:hypothetical protein EV380_1118 [Zhihengliuella halotolerans]|uniref:Uncharacterized protein n=2 Tax=Zhihengliuella halotolerans TaxID=370736 RepID=A0A4Q8ABK1_9MICC|nr:hypothetical protein EV380_1118 [Zhihengliuella halotolerans]